MFLIEVLHTGGDELRPVADENSGVDATKHGFIVQVIDCRLQRGSEFYAEGGTRWIMVQTISPLCRATTSP